jgi:hypothetical protein
MFDYAPFGNTVDVTSFSYRYRMLLVRRPVGLTPAELSLPCARRCFLTTSFWASCHPLDALLANTLTRFFAFNFAAVGFRAVFRTAGFIV